MTKQQKLLAFIKAGPGASRRWAECRDFYITIAPNVAIYKKDTSYTGMGGYDPVVLSEAEALRRNRYACRLAVDYSLYRLFKQGLVANPSRGLHVAV